ncbi:MAG: GWxTD domain-containing protein, partial [Ignavibacteriaceae bacterium]|nr:GWxTD domain-containing protein [Ignavibacteriaceae bacterium]
VLISLFIVTSICGQVPQKIFYSNVSIFPSDSLSSVYYSYMIGYKNLVFETGKGLYNAEFNVSLEITDFKSSSITRYYDSKIIEVKTYDETIDARKRLQGVLNFSLPDGKYLFSTIISDKNSGKELKPRPDTVIVKSESICQPIVSSNSIECDALKYPEFVNLGGNIPFTEKTIDLIIPVTSLDCDSIKVSINNDGTVLYQSVIRDKFISALGFKLCNESIIVKTFDDSVKTLNFIVKNINEKLPEGNIKISVEAGSEKQVFNKNVEWLNKPVSLSDAEAAIKSLEFIEEGDAIKKMLDNDEVKYPEVLREYWNKYNPTPSTAFNPLMNEYYQRIDYSAKNFKPIGKLDGIKTDRAKIYIKYGKPVNIERHSNGIGKVVETWYYEKPTRKFIFVDKDGIGNYILQNG